MHSDTDLAIVHIVHQGLELDTNDYLITEIDWPLARYTSVWTSMACTAVMGLVIILALLMIRMMTIRGEAGQAAVYPGENW